MTETQKRILEELSRNSRYMLARELAFALDMTSIGVATSLRGLVASGRVGTKFEKELTWYKYRTDEEMEDARVENLRKAALNLCLVPYQDNATKEFLSAANPNLILRLIADYKILRNLEQELVDRKQPIA